jgi:UDP-2,3-diacylglucosamine hydrolase
MKAYFISDIHIRSEDKTNGLKLIELLKNLPPDVTHLVLLGDIFDWWVGSHKYFVKRYFKLITEFKKLIAKGVEIHYFEGNHDLLLKKFWETELGMRVHSDEHFFNLEGLIVRAEHGDLMNKEDRSYLFLRKALRSFPVNFLMTELPGKLMEVIGDRFSRVSRFYTDRMNQEYKDKVKKLTREYAKNIHAERPFDLIVTGHTHVDDDYTLDIDSKKVRTVNLGSWLDRPKVFVVTTTEQKFIDL